MRHNSKILFFAAILAVSCSKSSDVTPTTPNTAEKYFRGGMDSVTIADDPNDKGNLKFNGWNSLKTNQYVESFVINDIGGKDYAYQEIVTKGTEKVMHAVVVNDDPNVSGTTRAQSTLTFKDGVNLDAYHSSVRMFFHSDVNVLLSYTPKVSWFDIWETWNAVVPGIGGDEAGSARWNLHIFKNENASTFYWVAAGETMEPTRTTIWTQQNKTIPIPINKWFTIDIYLKRGNASNGKYLIKITVDGEQTQTLFDITNWTVHPDYQDVQIKSWQAFKFYFDPVYLAWIQANGGGKTLQCYYNDFIWYKN